jgi:hypothetical protein
MRHDSVRDPRDCLGIEGNLIVVWLFLSIVLFLLPAEFGMARLLRWTGIAAAVGLVLVLIISTTE